MNTGIYMRLRLAANTVFAATLCVLASCALFTSIGCVPVDGVSTVKDPVQSRIANLEQRLASLQAQNPASTVQEVQTLKREVAELQGSVDALQHSPQKSRSVFSREPERELFSKRPAKKDLNTKQEKILADVAAPAPKKETKGLAETQSKVIRSDGNKVNPITHAIKAVNKRTEPHSAEQLFGKKKYLSASKRARTTLDSESADQKQKSEAQFWLAKSQMKLGNFETSALKFNQFIEGKSGTTAKKAEARFLLGEIFHKLGQSEVGNIYYREVLEHHKGTKLASKARRKLKG
jgi:TolA-binding protein